jgi:tetratricopeptide (TPR) repeat protein
LRPKSTAAYVNLGIGLIRNGDLDGAITAFQQVITIDGKSAKAHYNLGLALSFKKDLDGSNAAYYKAIHLDPKFVKAYNNLGTNLFGQKDYDGASDAFQKAIALNPNFEFPHCNLGNALRAKSDLHGAIFAYKKALAINPKYENASNKLGATYGELASKLMALQQYGPAREALVQALTYLTPGYKFIDSAKSDLKKCEQNMVVLDQKLIAVLAGQAQPKDGYEQLALADLCWRDKKLNAAAVQFYAAGLAAKPDLAYVHRYHAACAAALAAAGNGKDADMLQEKDRVKLRQQALDWLHAELAYWQGKMKAGQPLAKEQLSQHLVHWQRNTDLAGVREAAELAELSKVEQQAWQQFWAKVDKSISQKSAVSD